MVGDSRLGPIARRPRLTAGLLVAMAVLPFVIPTQHLENFVELYMYVSLVLSWNLLGYTGYLNFGHAAFFGTGAYIVGLSLTVFELPIVLGIILAGLAAGVLGLGLGAVTLRIRGHYFAIASLMLLFIMATIFTNVGDLVPGASQDIYFELLPELSIQSFRTVFYYVFLLYAVVLAASSIYLERSTLGYAMRAIGGDEDLASSLGVNTTLVKNMAITLSTFTAGVIGGTHVLYIQYLDPSVVFPVALNFLIVFIAFIGGVGDWLGPIVGAALFVAADELSRIYLEPEFAQLLFGVLFVIIILFRPEGLTRGLRDAADRYDRSELATILPFGEVREK